MAGDATAYALYTGLRYQYLTRLTGTTAKKCAAPVDSVFFGLQVAIMVDRCPFQDVKTKVLAGSIVQKALPGMRSEKPVVWPTYLGSTLSDSAPGPASALTITHYGWG